VFGVLMERIADGEAWLSKVAIARGHRLIRLSDPIITTLSITNQTWGTQKCTMLSCVEPLRKELKAILRSPLVGRGAMCKKATTTTIPLHCSMSSFIFTQGQIVTQHPVFAQQEAGHPFTGSW